MVTSEDLVKLLNKIGVSEKDLFDNYRSADGVLKDLAEKINENKYDKYFSLLSKLLG